MKTVHYPCALLLSVIFTLLFAAPLAQAAPGDLSPYNPNIGSSVLAMAMQPDGKMLVGIDFSDLGAFNGIFRLNSNGTLDGGFNVNFEFAPFTNQRVNSIIVQPDGKILLGGVFGYSAAGSPSYEARNIMRVNANGTHDASFAGLTTDGAVNCVAVQPDGKVLIGGNFTTVFDSNGGAILRYCVAQLEANGAFDTSFIADCNSQVTSITVLASGKILIGGTFSTIGGIPRQSIARLEANGALDTSFNANLNGPVNCVVEQPNGKLLIGGTFTSAGGVPRGRVARLEPDGTLDGTFDPNANNSVNSTALQADGKVLLGGTFTTLQPNGAGAATTRNRVARVNADGTLDPTFNCNANGTVNGFTILGDGRVQIGGEFTSLQPNGASTPTTRNQLARVMNDAATLTLNVSDTAHITWVRSGAAPEFSKATFEVSTNGGVDWGAPIAATPYSATGAWRKHGGIALPDSGQLRARGYLVGGYRSASSGFLEQVVSFSGLVHAPEIGISSNGVAILDGSTPADFLVAAFGASTAMRTFTITNTGTAPLNLTGAPKVVVSGAHAADFAITQQPTSPLAATNGTTTFQVTFTPGAVGVRNATLSLANNDADEAPFGLALTGRGLSFSVDTDSDGINDASELVGAALGFDWQVSQPALVQTYMGMANGAGLYTTAQVQALHLGTPLISRDVATGKFKLTLELTKKTTLAAPNWLAFPFTAPGTMINGQGKIEYEFTSPDDAAFFRLDAN